MFVCFVCILLNKKKKVVWIIYHHLYKSRMAKRMPSARYIIKINIGILHENELLIFL